MSTLGKVQIGKRAPDFRCDAVTKGVMQEVTLENFIREPTPSEPNPPWLILLFIPAAFSFVCPTEVLAFQSCLDEFRERNCEIVFVSVDTKHSLWHWQNVPKQFGGLGNVEISLLSDSNHHMSKNYGVLVEDEGVCLRGMFIIDDKGIVQQITLNNLTVGRSVLEALRLLEAFQAVAQHGVLCPVDWKPQVSDNIINTIANTLTESYEDRLRNLQAEFGKGPVESDEAPRMLSSMSEETEPEEQHISMLSSTGSIGMNPSAATSHALLSSSPPPSPPLPSKDAKRPTAEHRSSNPALISRTPTSSIEVSPAQFNLPIPSPSAPMSADVTPIATPSQPVPPPLKNSHSSSGQETPRQIKRHLSGPQHSHHYHSHPHHYHSRNQTQSAVPSSPGQNPDSTTTGSQMIAEFAEPSLSPPLSGSETETRCCRHGHKPMRFMTLAQKESHSHCHQTPPSSPPVSRRTSSRSSSGPLTPRSNSSSAPSHTTSSMEDMTSSAQAPSPSQDNPKATDPALQGTEFTHGTTLIPVSPSSSSTKKRKGSQTRLQVTYDVLKKIGAGLGSPKGDSSPKKAGGILGTGIKEREKEPGYFNAAV